MPPFYLLLPPLGLAMLSVGIIWFRHPGQRFFGNYGWRPSKFLKPTGVKLWITGWFLFWTGSLWSAGAVLNSIRHVVYGVP